MNLASTQYSLKYQAFEIYISGCKGLCVECCNPELKDFNYGVDFNINEINKVIGKIQKFDLLINSIWLLGGDCLDNNIWELTELIKILKYKTNKSIWLWTRYELNNIKLEIKSLCDYIKTGAYIKTLNNTNIQMGITLASSNQNIYVKGIDY